ncbi:MAG: DNA helicase [bacterium]|nr:MAG: DNA helicase [bacterium]
MSKEAPFKPPEIMDEDIRWAARLLGLPENAFHGEDGNDPRLDVLKCMNNMDVAACPGSGKTTLLVAKLAILANKWEHRTRGICVLSHTNAARREIEERLGCTAVGRQLLSYPHYIGTIHGFVDGFLALPWLRSNRYYGMQFNTDIAGAKLWKASNYGRNLPGYIYRKITNTEYRKAAVCHAHYVGEERDLILESHNVRLPLKRQNASEAFTTIDDWKQRVLEEGYAAYEDTFAFGHCVLSEYTELSAIFRERFPVLFIDEAQDNSEEQSKLLHRIFIAGGSGVVRQRFGDSNQAICNFVGTKGAITDAFPNTDVKKSVPNSHRFGTTIAKLAEPLGVDPHDGGLKGNGPRPICPESRSTNGPHTIFLFQDDEIDKVLPAYADLLIKTFSGEELKHGVFTAVGQVHNDTGDDHRPRHVGHYWTEYDSELSRANPQPQTFVQYVRSGQEQAVTTGEIHFGAEKIAQGILRLAGMAEGGQAVRTRRRSHRYVLELLDKEDKEFKLYHQLISRMVVKRIALTKRKWNRCWVKCIRKIGEKVAGASLASTDVNVFLEWRDRGLDADEHEKARCDNIYRYPEDDPKVHIKLGSIHSVKGQTHTSTLVLETFWYKHNLESLKEWVMGTNRNGSNLDIQAKSRLKLHYVAMTRPTHLLCLAMKRSLLNDSNGEDYIKTLREYGWDIRYV